ncbi:glycoside hydrolase family 71 protein [Rhodococcus sp. 27YEA15]|uniref:glycoside hydrolase family 71 protein n=1 Tax=Rhodococcus sp. 27YEA15 TaxID=3156259 RepID=UPI003C7D9517
MSALLASVGLWSADGAVRSGHVDVSSAHHLAFDVPADGRPTDKLVFAHYFPPYPISIDNKPSSTDYYASEYLSPRGEESAYASVGGFLRDRPQPRSVSTDPEWKVRDLENEVRQAIDGGIDGFTVDILTKSSNPLWSSSVPGDLLAAAAAVDPRFKIMLMPDMNSELGALDPEELADELSQYTAAPAVFHLQDARLVVSPFLAERHDPAWWSSFMDVMKNRYGIDVAFVPMFLDSTPNMETFAPISYGMSTWGGRNAAFNPVTDTGVGSPMGQVNRAHQLGKVWMQSVSFQDARPSQSVFDEADNTENLRNMWQIARDSNSEWVQLITWNDYSEGTSFAPSVGHGQALLDLNAYYVDWFKAGVAPNVTRDAAYLTYRGQLSTAQPSDPSASPMVLRAGSAPVSDTVEVLTYLVASAAVEVTTGGITTTCQVGAGVDVCTVPAGVGSVSAHVVRDGVQVAVVQGHSEITSTPAVQNMEYLMDSSSR